MREEVRFTDYLDVLFRYRRLILAFMLGGVVAGGLKVLLSPRIYEAHALVRLSLTETRIPVLPQVSFSQPYIYDPLESEIALMYSRTLQTRAVMRIGGNLWLEKNRYVQMDTAYSEAVVKDGEYTLQLKGDSVVLFTEGDTLVFRGTIRDTIRWGGFAFTLKPLVDDLEGVNAKLSLVVAKPTDVGLKVSVLQKGRTNLVEITARGNNPKTAARRANALATEYIEYTLYGLREEARHTRKFIEEQLAKLDQELDSAEAELQRFKEEAGILVLSTAAEAISSRLAGLESQRARAVADRAEAEMLARKYLEELKGNGFYEEYKRIISNPEISTNPLVAQLKQRITQLQVQRAQLSSEYGPSHPKIVAIDRAIQEAERELERALAASLKYGPSAEDPVYQMLITGIVEAEARKQALDGKIQALTRLIQETEKQMRKFPAKEVRLAELQRRVSVTREIYNTLLDRLQEARIAEASKTSDAKVIDYAQPPRGPISPKPKKDLLLWTVIGLLLGVLGAFVLEYMDNTVKTSKEVEKLLGFPVLGVIPWMESTDQETQPLVTHFDPKSPVAEAYRTLRSNVRFAALGKPLKVLLVTSSVAKEGKTSTATNLAVAMAQSGQRVLLVDADLRNPRLNRVFKVKREPGLSDVLIGRASLSESVYEVSDIPNLYLLPCGPIPPNPAELLSSQALQNLLETLKQEYDLVILDSAPLLPVSDSVELGKLADGVILVVRAGVTERDFLEEVKRILENARLRVLGVVLNAVDLARHYGYYRYRYYRYYRYSYSHMKEPPPTLWGKIQKRFQTWNRQLQQILKK